ncbi:MAG: Ger(x)C family spore germination protein [Eubacteriales bacterium]
MNKKNIFVFLIIFFAFLIIPGCWNRSEIEKKAIVAGMGIDREKDNDKVDLTLQVVVPRKVKSTGEGEKAVWIVSSTGSSVFEAGRNFGLQSGRKALWSHAQVLVIGEEAAKKGINEFIDYFERDHEVRRRICIMVAKGDAKDIMNANVEIEKIPAFSIRDLGQAGEVTSKISPVCLQEFIGMISSKTSCAYTPGIEVFEEEDEKENKEKKDKRLRLTDTAVFKEYKLRGWFDQYETRGMLWIIGKVQSGIIEVECLKGGKTPTSLEILRTKSKIIPEIKNGKITITVEVSELGNVGATPIPCADLSDPQNIKELERRENEVIKKEIKQTIKKAKEFNTDVFGFGEAVYRKYPKEWEELEDKWDEIFPNLEIIVKVDAKIRRTGLLSEAVKSE